MHTWYTHLLTHHVLHITHARYLLLTCLTLITWFYDFGYVLFRNLCLCYGLTYTNQVCVPVLCFYTCCFVLCVCFCRCLLLSTLPDYTFCPVVIQLSWPFNFLHAPHVWHILASHHLQASRELPLDAHTWSILHTLSHTTLTLFPPKYKVSKYWITSKFGTE